MIYASDFNVLWHDSHAAAALLTACGNSDIYFLDCREKTRRRDSDSIWRLVGDACGRFVRAAGPFGRIG